MYLLPILYVWQIYDSIITYISLFREKLFYFCEKDFARLDTQSCRIISCKLILLQRVLVLVLKKKCQCSRSGWTVSVIRSDFSRLIIMYLNDH